MGQLRRSYENFKRELNADETFREVQDGVRDVRRLTETPRRMRDPKHLFDALTDERRSTPATDAPTAPSPRPEQSAPDVSDA
jgi:hypothetical protein